MTETSVVVDFLVRSLQQVDPRPLKGSELAVFLRTVHPEFTVESLGYRTLREFIHRHATEIVEVGRAGMDIQYRLKTTQQRFESESISATPSSRVNYALDQLTRNPRVWKTFTSPDSAFNLYLTETGMLRAMHSSSRPLPEWRDIPRISAEKLLQIGTEFTAGVDDLQRSVLAPILGEPKWWIPFFDRLQSLGLKSKWIEFRQQKIRDEFRHRIEGAEATPRVSERSSEPPSVTFTPLAEVSTKIQSELLIRKIAADVVQRMTESELRSLNLPLGYVVDSLTTR